MSEPRDSSVKVLILGAGQVGETLAQRMVSESSDVTLVDSDRQRLDRGLSISMSVILSETQQASIAQERGCRRHGLIGCGNG